MSALTHVGEDRFESEVMQAEGLVLVDFYADWCGPCRMLGPVLEKLAEKFAGRAKVVKVNVDEEGGLAMQYGISGIPAVLFFKDGQIVDNVVGLRSPADFEALVEKWAA